MSSSLRESEFVFVKDGTLTGESCGGRNSCPLFKGMSTSSSEECGWNCVVVSDSMFNLFGFYNCAFVIFSVYFKNGLKTNTRNALITK